MSLIYLDNAQPSDFGLDSKEYPSFREDPVSGRPVQLEVIELAISNPKRFTAICAPTGFGKSVAALVMQKYLGCRGVVLTATKGLQDQYKKMEKYGLVDVRGKDNYECQVEGTCREGSMRSCPAAKSPMCTYNQARERAKKNDGLVSTNYAYWIKAAKGLGEFGLLILDEAHIASEVLGSQLGMRLYETELKKYNVSEMGDELSEWQSWVKENSADIKQDLGLLKASVRKHATKRVTKAQVESVFRLEAIIDKLDKIRDAVESDWVVEKHIGGKFGRYWAFDVVRPGRYAEGSLYRGIEKVVFLSATLNRKHLQTLNVPSDEVEYREWDRIFPKHKCPVYCLPAKNEQGKAIRVTRKMKDEDKVRWVEHMDALMEESLGERIVLLTTSYAYQQFIMDHSRFARYMVGNTSDPDSDTAMEVFEKFIVSPPPVILCSPSFGTGWSFDDDRGRLLIISKVPLKPPEGSSKLQKARLARDPELNDAETMTELVQAGGRLQRGFDDWGKVVIADGSWAWFGHRNKRFAPRGWVDEVRKEG